MRESIILHPALERSLVSLNAPAASRTSSLRPLGHKGLDEALGGGLPTGQLHEIFALEAVDTACATGFGAMLALCLGGPDAPVFWLREEKRHQQAPLHAPGLAEIGLDPGRLVVGLLPDMLSLLRSGVDVLRCPAVGALVLEVWDNPALLDLTASRRLLLAAETSGVTPLLLRIGANPVPSAARTRWAVRPVASCLADAEAPGFPTIDLTLLRRRGGAAGMNWQVEWDRDSVSFREPAFSGAPVSLPGSGQVAAGGAPRGG